MFIFDFEDTISFTYVDDNTTKAKLFKDSWAKGITNLAAAAGLDPKETKNQDKGNASTLRPYSRPAAFVGFPGAFSVPAGSLSRGPCARQCI